MNGEMTVIIFGTITTLSKKLKEQSKGFMKKILIISMSTCILLICMRIRILITLFEPDCGLPLL